MNPVDIINNYYKPGSLSHDILMVHSEAVARKAAKIAEGLDDPAIDRDFIYDAAKLHDIGIFYTDAPGIGCFGNYPYMCHGYLGRNLLEELGMEKHALVAERHVGAGLTKKEIIEKDLPLPARDMLPLTIEEIIICVADKFFSKNPDMKKEFSLSDVMAKIETYGRESMVRFESWLKILGDVHE
ncbi:MAG: HD domain-containing protein [Deltaproteobacteria bacterium]|nr:HD domain-containing protein [Deltaproteobacteria bacterium]